LTQSLNALKLQKTPLLTSTISLKKSTEDYSTWTELTEKYGKKTLSSPRKTTTYGLPLNEYLKFVQEWAENDLKQVKLNHLNNHNNKVIEEAQKMKTIEEVKLSQRESQSYHDKVSKMKLFCLISKELEPENWQKIEFFIDLNFLKIRINVLEMIYTNKNTCKRKNCFFLKLIFLF
jgi:hypothetical protein